MWGTRADRMSNTTYIDRIRLMNFRGFNDLTIDFDPHLTVLVARNGMGKTAVIDGCVVALRYFVDVMVGRTGSAGFSPTDMRVEFGATGRMIRRVPTTLTAKGRIDGIPTAWKRERARLRGRTTYADAKALGDRAGALKKQLIRFTEGSESEPPVLPVIAAYGTGRLWSEPRTSKARNRKATTFANPLDAYTDCLDPRSSFKGFALWFEAASREAQRLSGAGPSNGAPHPQSFLQAIQRATDEVLRFVGWHSLQWSFYTSSIVATHDSFGELPVTQLSDGVRNALALVADVAHRAVRLNPQFGEEAPKRTPGIVLIDEVDMHLHPGWQQAIIGSLRRAFPQMQFIVTTHSPQVLSTVPSECIRVLEDSESGVRASVPSLQTEGVASADVMASVMKVASTPDVPIRGQLERYRALIQDGAHETPEAQALRHLLNEHFGEKHPEVVDLDRLIRFRKAVASRKSG